MPPLVLSNRLNDVAQHHAAYLARVNQFAHSGQKPYGENVYAASNPTPPRPDKVVDGWYNDIRRYDFKQPGFRPETGRCTQVVWEASHELAIGIAHAADGMWYVVGNYRAPGTIVDQFATNVLPPTY
jgi:hypothetical protein